MPIALIYDVNTHEISCDITIYSPDDRSTLKLDHTKDVVFMEFEDYNKIIKACRRPVILKNPRTKKVIATDSRNRDWYFDVTCMCHEEDGYIKLYDVHQWKTIVCSDLMTPFIIYEFITTDKFEDCISFKKPDVPFKVYLSR